MSEQIKRYLMLALTGALAAAWTDFDAFKKFKSWKDLVGFDWGLASFRWFKGAILGVIGASGWNAMWGE